MAPELRKRKEKAAPAKEEMPPAKKTARAAPAPKRKAADDASVASPIAPKKQKPVAKAAEPKAKVTKEAKAEKATKAKTTPKKSKAKAPEPEEEEPVQEQEQEQAAEEDAEEEEVDDQTKALVSAIDSDNDEADVSAEKSTFTKGQDVGKIPKVSSKTKKSAEKAVAPATEANGKGEGTGVVYVGRIPHGFYEHEMRQYFSQFGPISRLRLSRNKKTGASKHFAFIEFGDEDTAEIVAKTMDGYLLFGHILRCKVVPESQIHESLWKGANRRFKKVPWNKMAGKQLERPLSESKWEAKISKEEKRRLARAEKLKEMDYEFDTPALKAAEAKAPAAIENVEEAKAIEEAPAAAESEEKEKEVEKAEEPAAVEEKSEEVAESTPSKKAKATKKKGRKSKA